MKLHFAKLFAKVESEIDQGFKKRWQCEHKIEPGNRDEKSIVGLNLSRHVYWREACQFNCLTGRLKLKV